MKHVEVCIPTYKPGKELKKLLLRLLDQDYPVDKIHIINTGEEYWDSACSLPDERVEVVHIAKEDFDHALTRNALGERCRSDYILFMTQDALPQNRHLIASLVEGFSVDPSVGVVYARQLAGENASTAEKLNRCFNYPGKSRLKKASDGAELGIKTFFCSNVCALYDRALWERLGRFFGPAIFNEDMVYACRMQKKGMAVYYQEKARVFHSHNYSLKQDFKRSFDLAVSQAMAPDVFSGISSEGEGKKLVLTAAKTLILRGQLWTLFLFVLHCAAKYAGYFLGRRYRRLPDTMVLACSSQPGFWRKRKSS